jgi:malate synthase
MEDLATARISVAQIAQRIRHAAKDASTGQAHDFALVKRLLQEELANILDTLKDAGQSASVSQQAEERYQKALKISYRWIKNYTELNFRGLGSYTRADLNEIVAQADAF